MALVQKGMAGFKSTAPLMQSEQDIKLLPRQGDEGAEFPDEG